MANHIKYLFRVILFCLSTTILTGYIEIVQATKQEVMEKEILQNKTEAILEAAAKRSMQINNRDIKFILKGNREEQIKLKKLQNLLNFSLKEHKKYFFKLSLEQLQLIFPKLEKLQSLSKKFGMAIKELMNKPLKSVGKVEKKMEEAVLNEAFQKEVEKEIELEFQEMIRTIQALRKNPQTIDAILLANDLEILYDADLFVFQNMQEDFLRCSFIEQQFLLPRLKKVRRLLEEQVEIEKELMVAMPGTLKKKLQEVVKKISQKVHGILDSCTKEKITTVCIIKRMMLLH